MLYLLPCISTKLCIVNFQVTKNDQNRTTAAVIINASKKFQLIIIHEHRTTSILD